MSPVTWFRVVTLLAGAALWVAVPLAWRAREHAGVLFVMMPAVAIGALLVLTGILGPERFVRLGERRRRPVYRFPRVGERRRRRPRCPR